MCASRLSLRSLILTTTVLQRLGRPIGKEQNMSSWWWWWSQKPTAPLKPTDALHSQALRNRFNHFLDHTDPPASFGASQVAKELTYNELRELGYWEWKEVLPAVIELAFELREAGYCEILKGGQVLPGDVGPYDIEGSVRIRRVDD